MKLDSEKIDNTQGGTTTERILAALLAKATTRDYTAIDDGPDFNTHTAEYRFLKNAGINRGCSSSSGRDLNLDANTAAERFTP